MSTLAETIQTKRNISNNPTKNGHFTILGITNKGGLFRPNDWAERLLDTCNLYAQEDDTTNQIHSYIRLTEYKGIKGVVVNHELENFEAVLYNFLLGFAKDNHLNTI